MPSKPASAPSPQPDQLRTLQSASPPCGSPMAGAQAGGAPWRSAPDECLLSLPPGMISPDERKYLGWLIREHFQGCGVILDMGVFTGASTCIFGEALRAIGRDAPATIHSYDRFIMDAMMPRWIPSLREGDSFLSVWEEYTQHLGQIVVCHPGDLLQMRWSGGPAEIIFVDIMKGWPLCEHVTRAFFPALIEGGYLVHQDIKFWATPWIIYVMSRLRHCYEPAHNVIISTIGFRCLRQLRDADLDFEFGPQVFADKSADEHFDWLLDYLPEPLDRVKIEGARARGYFQAGRADLANAVMDRARENYPANGYVYHCLPAARGFEQQRPEESLKRDQVLQDDIHTSAEK